MNNDIPKWITTLALDIYRLIQKYDTLTYFQEKIREWTLGHEAEANRHLEWRRQRKLHFEQVVNSDSHLQDEKSGPPDVGWELESYPLNISPQINPDTKRSIKFVKAWVPPELSKSVKPEVIFPLPLRKNQQLTIIEKGVILAAVYECARKGTVTLSPWECPDNLDELDELLNFKRSVPFITLCDAASKLDQDSEGWLKAILADIEKDLSEEQSAEPKVKRTSMLDGKIFDFTKRLIQTDTKKRHRPFFDKLNRKGRELQKSGNNPCESSNGKKIISNFFTEELEDRASVVWKSLRQAHKALGSQITSTLASDLNEVANYFLTEITEELSEFLLKQPGFTKNDSANSTLDLAKNDACEKIDIEIDLYVNSLTNGLVETGQGKKDIKSEQEGMIEPKPPEHLQNLLWYIKYGLKHWKLILIAIIIILGIFFWQKFEFHNKIFNLFKNKPSISMDYERTPLYTRTKKRVDDCYESIRNEKLDPWLFINVKDVGVEVVKHNGDVITCSGVLFTGSPRLVFWSDDFIPPFIEDAIIKVFDQTIEECRKNDLDPEIYVFEANRILGDFIYIIYNRMADMDQKLMRQSYSKSFGHREVSKEIEKMRKRLEVHYKAAILLASGK